ncbi:MAG: fumarylacetoacetase [bacterium]|nr:fumarylacetoacetase [bacterium]
MNTTDPTLKSFLPVAPDSDFPIQNLPYGVARKAGCCDDERFVVSIVGDTVINLARLEEYGYFDTPELLGKTIFAQPTLNEFMACGKAAWQEARDTLSRLLRDDCPTLRDNPDLREAVLYRLDEVEMMLPVDIGDYTDFYSSREHATNVGIMFRGKENALMPNWLHLPVGYHGRASSIVVSGEPIARPQGQTKGANDSMPQFGPTKQLDFELEMGFFIGTGNKLGEPIPTTEAEEKIFGFVLVNDWSARDIQAWEYVPLGPFLAKNFATSISPWVVTMEALAPFRCEGPQQDPEPLPYLRTNGNSTFDITLDVLLQTATMNAPEKIAQSNYKHLYWNVAQHIAHHTITGCNLRPGDLLASGTISGPTPDARGSMLELSWRGTEPLTLSNGEQRSFLQDGDTLAIRGYCQGQSYRIGFGEVVGKVVG